MDNEDFERYKAENEKRLGEIMDAMAQNTAAVRELTENTKGVVQLHSDMQGAVRLGTGVQKFIVWTAKWGVIGTAAAASLDYVVSQYVK